MKVMNYRAKGDLRLTLDADERTLLVSLLKEEGKRLKMDFEKLDKDLVNFDSMYALNRSRNVNAINRFKEWSQNLKKIFRVCEVLTNRLTEGEAESERV